MATFWQEMDRLMTKIDIWIKKTFGGLQIEAVKAKQVETPKNSPIAKVRDFSTDKDVIRISPRPRNTTVDNAYNNAERNFIGAIEGTPVKEQEFGLPTGFNQKESTMRKKVN